jgi:Putative MetA-pathway of phenol degradation
MTFTAQTGRAHLITALVASPLLVGSVCASDPSISTTRRSAESSGSRAEDDGEVNSGQDITKPVRRFDLRFQYTNAGDISTPLEEFHPNVCTMTLRTDIPMDLGNGFKFNTRLDLPMSINDVPTRDNPGANTAFNVNDVLVQGLLIKAVNKDFAFGFGTQLIIPTGTDDSFTANRWQLVPTVGTRWSLPQITKGSFFVFGARYAFDFAGDDGRPHTSVLQFSPTLNIALPDRWFVTLFPSTDIRVDLENGGKWFVPADFLIGKMLNKTTVASVEFGIPIIKQFDLYDFKVEARIGFFF